MDKKQKKRLKRSAKKKTDKAQAQQQHQQLKKQMNMFGRLPEACNTCGEAFPKTREAHMSWRVAVRSAEEQVRLFCPDCQNKASTLAEKQNEV